MLVTAATVYLGCAQVSGVDELTFDRARRVDASEDVDGVDAGEDVDAEVSDVALESDTPLDGSSGAPFFGGLQQRCKLINDTNVDDPTPNNTHFRANLSGSSLGIAVVHEDQLYLFFGDTGGAQEIWPRNTASLPDAVGYAAVPYASVAKDPDLLCSNLRFLLSGEKTGDVEADFAGAKMLPPSGHKISEFIHNPAGPYKYVMQSDMPGSIEVPSGAFSYGGSIYVFYTIANLSNPYQVQGSYLAKWDAPSTAGKPEYRILYHVDQRFDANGPLRGNFINIAALVDGDYLYLYGTGKYRASPVHLARKLLSTLETEGGFESYDPAMSSWVAADKPVAPIVAMPNIGELSVQYYPAIGRYVMLDQEENVGNRIAARFARSPQGPWSDAVTVATMTDPAFADKYCCADECLGEQLLHCDQGGFFGTYLLPDVIVHPDASFTITFTMSIWEPYNVALMSATFK